MRHQFSVLAADARPAAARACRRALYVRSDPHLLRRIVQNFLSNALRYTRRGGVLLGVRRRGGTVSIEVWDTGPGIAHEHLRMIFDEFRRLEQPSPWGEKGLGLGLAICERIARMLDHELERRFASRARQPFLDPRAARRRSRGGTSARMLRRTSPIGLPSALHVLCLDNDPHDPRRHARAADALGRELRHCAQCGRSRTGRASPRRPDLILADYHLDDAIDGLAALDHLREVCTPPPPGALITADASLELKTRARDLRLCVAAQAGQAGRAARADRATRAQQQQRSRRNAGARDMRKRSAGT